MKTKRKKKADEFTNLWPTTWLWMGSMEEQTGDLDLNCRFPILFRKMKAKEYMPRNQWKGLELVVSKFLGER